MCMTTAGRLFQTRAAATAKEQSVGRLGDIEDWHAQPSAAEERARIMV